MPDVYGNCVFVVEATLAAVVLARQAGRVVSLPCWVVRLQSTGRADYRHDYSKDRRFVRGCFLPLVEGAPFLVPVISGNGYGQRGRVTSLGVKQPTVLLAVAGGISPDKLKPGKMKTSDQVVNMGKYVVTGGMPVLLPLLMRHDSVETKSRITSAGFYTLLQEADSGALRITCEGASESLQVSSRPEADAALIRQYFFGS